MPGKKSNNKAKTFEDPQKVYEKIGNNLKRLRLEAGYPSYLSFAYENQMTPSQYGRYEKGSNMRLDTLLTILSIHNLTIEEFFKSMK